MCKLIANTKSVKSEGHRLGETGVVPEGELEGWGTLRPLPTLL